VKYSFRKKELVAYHEAGHAIIGVLVPDYDKVRKVSIMPRGAAGGVTFFQPLRITRIAHSIRKSIYSHNPRCPRWSCG
jgi:ATP-dependent Zn protease